MCEVCAIFGAGEHWSDFGRTRDERYPFDDIMHFRKERARRLSLINRILGKIGATCEDWDGEAVAVHDRSGRFKLAATLNDIWPAAEALTGRRIDPLDADFLPPSGRFSAEAA